MLSLQALQGAVGEVDAWPQYIPVGQLAAPKAIIHAHAPSLTSMCTALAHVRGSQVARLVWHLRHAAVFESLVSSRMMPPLVVRWWGCE